MKKNFFLSASAIMLLLAMNSCKTAVVEPDTTLQFSTQTVEQQKASIEQSGLDLADKMNGLKETPAYAAINYLSDGQLNAPALLSPFSQLRANLLKNDVKALEVFNNQMKIAANAGDDIWGTWTWNQSTRDFDRTFGAANKAIFYFPTSAVSTNNNGVITILYSESNVAIPEVTPVQFYPKNLSIVFTIGGNEAMNAQFTGAYQTDGTPTSILQTLVIGAYNWSTSVTNKSTEVSANYTFNYNTQVLLKYDMGATGSFTATQIEDAMNDDSKGPEDVVTGGYMSFQVMNVAVYGGITDTKGFVNEGNALEPDSTLITSEYGNYYRYIYGKSYMDKEVSIFNKYLKFYGYFVDPKEKFADVEFYTAEELGPDYNTPATLVYTQLPGGKLPTVKYDYYYLDYNYNSATGNYDYTYYYYAYATKTNYYAQPRLVLSDGSKITNFDQYANDNFKTLIDKFNSMLPNN